MASVTEDVYVCIYLCCACACASACHCSVIYMCAHVLIPASSATSVYKQTHRSVMPKRWSHWLTVYGILAKALLAFFAAMQAI
jgi:hypothetical protein